MNSLLYIISTIIIVVSAVVLSFYGSKLLEITHSKGKLVKENKKIDDILSKIDNTIILSITAVNKSMVNKLKQSSSFLQQEKEEAFYEAKDRVMNILNEEEMQNLTPYIKNFDEWINNRIEYYVKNLKKL